MRRRTTIVNMNPAYPYQYVLSTPSDLWSFYTDAQLFRFSVIKQIHVCNTASISVSLSLWLSDTSGATVGGTEITYQLPIPAYSVWDWSGLIPIMSERYLVGQAGGDQALVIRIDGEAGVLV